MNRSADISPCGKYRYRLARHWGSGDPAYFVMLNPSTADADIDDPTIRRCINFAQREGRGGLVVLNLFALRATNPDVLQWHPDPHGPENGRYLAECLANAAAVGAPVICAWGAHPAAVGVGRAFRRLAVSFLVPLQCLGQTTSGAPRHPLYLPAVSPLRAWHGWG